MMEGSEDSSSSSAEGPPLLESKNQISWPWSPSGQTPRYCIINVLLGTLLQMEALLLLVVFDDDEPSKPRFRVRAQAPTRHQRRFLDFRSKLSYIHLKSDPSDTSHMHVAVEDFRRQTLTPPMLVLCADTYEAMSSIMRACKPRAIDPGYIEDPVQ